MQTKIEWIGFKIEIGVFKNFKECVRSPCNENHFSSVNLGVRWSSMCEDPS